MQARQFDCQGSFNSRPCEGATPAKRLVRLHVEVSIHAPVKGRPGVTYTVRGSTLFQFTPL